MIHSRFNVVAVGLVLFVSVCGVSHGARRPRQPNPPDFTKGERVLGKKNSWALGVTGAHGEIWADRKTLRSEGATQCLIVAVDDGTPAVGLLKEGDVILGADAPALNAAVEVSLFEADVRTELAAALVKAEDPRNGGLLALKISRDGKEQIVTLELPAMGVFSESSPWDCKKTEAIIERACDYLVDRGFEKRGGIQTHLDALGLLATGEECFIPIVRDYAHRMAPQELSLDINQGMVSWNWAYTTLFLAEYYLATDDAFVVPALTEYATTLAMGQSGAGTWGHSMARPSENGGKLHGPCGGYGSMNQIGLTCTLALVMAQKCGIENDEITQAIEKASTFLRFYVDKGSLPYGDHAPWGAQDDNGKNSQAAVLFDLMGDAEAATYFSKMTLASQNVRERGHTGHFFSFQWGALGAARSGDAAATAFMREMRWFYELERRPDGNFVYQRQLANADHDKYRGWSTTGSRLLHYCLPRKHLYITGKGGHAARTITGKELEAAVAAGSTDYLESRSVQDLLALLGSWSPTVRDRAGRALGERDKDVVPELIEMLKSENRYARYGACKGLRYAGRGSEAGLDALIRHGLRSDALTMRWFALDALRNPDAEKGMRAVVARAVPDLVKMGLTHYPEEPRGWTKTWVANTLCEKRGVFIESPELFLGLDSDTRVNLVRSLLTVQDGRARSRVGNLYAKLGEQELTQLWGAIFQATQERAPSGTMFADGIRAKGIGLMAKHGIKEGLPLALSILKEDRWGRYGRKMSVIPALKPYGAAAKKYLPELKMLADDLVKKNKGIQAAFDAIEGDDSPELWSLPPNRRRRR